MSEPAPYRVLARKYRPQSFEALVGQEAMVRTLTNAFEQKRIAHAFILTGVRGVGKTTTARIIARALNCVGADGSGGPTTSPCGVCENCRRIAEDRHVDVLEMDAASRTGIDDIREIIESVRYAPASARYKIYIIDEVHMLSTAAFNGLLKTLEEPPPHVKFIFATTEIRKVPVTVLSRCQRFDLRRIEAEQMIRYLAEVAAKEKVEVEREALALIARAAEGSMRDGLSLLDQAVAHGAGDVLVEAVREMLGLADRSRVFVLYDLVMRGDAKAALAELDQQYAAGADPMVVLQDMLELTHWLTRIKVAPEAANDSTAAPEERSRAADMAGRLGMPVLSRTWQMLLKGIGETREAAKPIQAAEMVLVRLAYAAELPPPQDLIKQLQSAPPTVSTPASSSKDTPARTQVPVGNGSNLATDLRARETAEPQPQFTPAPAPSPLAGAALPPQPLSFAAVVALAGEMRELVLKGHLANFVHLVHFEPGRIEFRPAAGAPQTLPWELSEKLSRWTKQRWVVTVSRDEGAPTLRQQEEEKRHSQKQAVEDHPLVAAAMKAFPGATIRQVRGVPSPDATGVNPIEDGFTKFEDGDPEL